MAERLEDLLRACTVRITGGPTSGAGFFVAPGKVLTCAHVIGDSAAVKVYWERDGQRPREARVYGPAAVLADGGRPIPALEGAYPDIAVLEVGGVRGHPCVRIDPELPSDGDNFQVFGYPREGGAVRLTPARLTYRGIHGIAPARYLDLAADTIKPGMSGAPVLNLRTGGVCGVVVASKNLNHSDGALAVPWSEVAADMGELLTANREFQVRDRRWNAAARRWSRSRSTARRTIAVGVAAAIAALVLIASQLVRSWHGVEHGSLSGLTASRPSVTPLATPGLPLETFRVPVTALKPPLTEIFSHSRMASAATVTGFEFRNSAINNLCLTAMNTGPTAGENKDPVDVSACRRTPNQVWIPVQWEADGSKFTWLANYQFPSMCLNADSINGFRNGHRTQLWNCYRLDHPAESESWDFGDWYDNVKSGAKSYPIFLGSGVFCLDADKFNLRDGNAVNIWNQYTTANQYWS
jgi:hypothetical protein